MDIVEVLHSTVGDPQGHHRLQLLRHHHLGWVGQNRRRGVIQQGRVVHPLRPRCDRIAETHVDLHRDSRPGQACLETHANTSILVGHADLLPADGRGVELEGILARQGTQLSYHADHLLHAARTAAQQIQVPGGAASAGQPQIQQNPALEHVGLSMTRAAEPVEESFDGKVRQDALKFHPSFARQMREASPLRGGLVAGMTAGHHSIACR